MKKNIYEILVKVLFFVYLAGMLSFGRAFAVIRIVKIGSIPIYVTEILLLIALPLIVMNFKQILGLPKKFLFPLFVYFVFGCLCLIIGVSDNDIFVLAPLFIALPLIVMDFKQILGLPKKFLFPIYACLLFSCLYSFFGASSYNFFALRDIVLCGYILFLPLTLIAFSNKKDMMLFLGILFVCNLIGLALGRLWMFKLTNSLLPTHLYNVRTFNLGLYYGITVSFMIAFFSFLKKKWHKLLVLFLVSLNIYVLTLFKARTIWAAGIALIIFFLFIFWKNLLKVILCFIPIIIIVFSILGYYDSDSPIRLSNRYVSTKGDMKAFIKKDIVSQKIPASGEVSRPASEEPFETTPEGLPIHKLPSRWLFKHRSNLVWRLDMWYQAIYFGLKSPFFGRGFGVYPQYVVWFLVKPPPARIGMVSRIIPAHNHLISIFYKMGLLGLVLFLVINYYVFSYGLRYIKKCKTDFTRCFLIGSLGSFVFWHTTALFFDVIDSPPTSIFLWVIIGLIFSIIKIDKESHQYQPKAKTKFTNKSKVVSICGIKVNIIQIPEVIRTMEGWIKSRNFGNYIAVSNALDVVLGKKDSRIRDAVNDSSLSVPDGVSLVLAAKAYGYDLKKRVYGPDLLLEFLKATQDKDYSHFFYGTTEQTLERLVESLKKQFPKLRVSGTHPSFFRDITAEEKGKVAKIINDSSVDVLWVGIGCPRQALWMHDFRDRLKVPVMVGVGAAFDFLSGTKPQAPRWIRDNGFEWLFRLITEPKRLWKRYLIGNLVFLWLFLKEFVKVKILKRDSLSLKQ